MPSSYSSPKTSVWRKVICNDILFVTIVKKVDLFQNTSNDKDMLTNMNNYIYQNEEEKQQANDNTTCIISPNA